MIVGYARTSTVDQVAGLEDQLAALKAAGCERLYSEHVSAVAVERRQLEACLAWLREGDQLVVTKPDRLARNVTSLLAVKDELEAQRIGLKVLSLGDVDLTDPAGKMLLTILVAVATWEREIMLERQRVGISAAKAAGKYLGRKPTAQLKAAEIRDLAQTLRRADGSPDCPAIADRLGLHRTSVWRVLRSSARHENGDELSVAGIDAQTVARS